MSFVLDFHSGSVVKNPPAKTGDVRWIPGSKKTPLEKERATTPVFLPGKSHGQRSLVGDSPLSCKIVGHGLVTKQ